MEGKEIQNGGSAKSGESKSSEELEKALQTFIDEADQQKPQTNCRYDKITNYFSQPKNFLDVAGVVILLIYTIVTIGLWCAQQVSNSINHQSLIDVNRPWVKVTLVPNELFWLPGRLDGSMTPNFMVTNVGHSPALRVKGVDLVYLNGSSETLILAQKNACAFLADNNARGVVLFPNDSVDLSRPDGEGAIGTSIGQIEVQNGKIISPSHGKTVSFMLYGCVDYQFGNLDQHFQTVFAYYVTFITHRPIPPDVVSNQFVWGQNISASDIKFVQATEGNYAN